MLESTIMTEGYYFGRFQPPLIKHAEIARAILDDHPEIHLTISIADNQIEPLLTQENFLHGIEVEDLFIKTLSYLGLESVGTALVALPTKPFVDSLRDFFKSTIQTTTKPALVFSGSPSTIKACEQLSDEFGVQVTNLNDDDLTGPRSRQIRGALINGWLGGLEEMITPEVASYLTSKNMVERIRNLPSTPDKKRPWAGIPQSAS